MIALLCVWCVRDEWCVVRGGGEGGARVRNKSRKERHKRVDEVEEEPFDNVATEETVSVPWLCHNPPLRLITTRPLADDIATSPKAFIEASALTVIPVINISQYISFFFHHNKEIIKWPEF